MNYRLIPIIFFGLLLFTSCKQKVNKVKSHKKETVKIQVPIFNEDTAYQYIKNQVDFGPRVPGTKAHKRCAAYFVDFFESIGLKVYQQKFKARTFDEKVFDGLNIIASVLPESKRRVLLCAHWDSRPFADHDSNPANHYAHIDGANDGASGVGVLMEIARQISIDKPNIGIDIVLFDLEDYGQHAQEKRNGGSDETWCLGSQYWAKTPHIAGYDARFGILLDMVGAKDAVFYKESFSNYYAPGVLNKVWKTAEKIGYKSFFVDEQGGSVLDDHIFINKIAYIPTINIIHYENSTNSSFFPHWHTMEDKIDKISPESLKAVGQTVLEVVYNEK